MTENIFTLPNNIEYKDLHYSLTTDDKKFKIIDGFTGKVLATLHNSTLSFFCTGTEWIKVERRGFIIPHYIGEKR